MDNEATEAERGQLNDPEITQLVRDEAEIQTQFTSRACQLRNILFVFSVLWALEYL